MTMRFQNKDSLSLNLSVGGNSPDANPIGYNGSPLAAFGMEALTHRDKLELAAELIHNVLQQT